MKTHGAITAGLILTALAGISVASASKPEATLTVVRGQALTAQTDGSWKQAESAPVGAWLKSAKPETVVRIPGMTLRMESGAKVRVTQINDQSSKLDARGGRVFVKMDAGSDCRLSAQDKTVVASQGEFVVDSGEKSRLYVFSGDAKLLEEAPKYAPAATWAQHPDGLALDGPDVRRRNKNRKRFTQGEENQGKRIGEDQPPTYSPSPSATQSPAYTPSPTPPSPSYSPPPSASASPPPQQDGLGVDDPVGDLGPWDVLGPVIGAGAVAGAVIGLQGGDDDDRPFLVASP